MIVEGTIVGNQKIKTEKKGKTKEHWSGASRSWLKLRLVPIKLRSLNMAWLIYF